MLVSAQSFLDELPSSVIDLATSGNLGLEIRTKVGFSFTHLLFFFDCALFVNHGIMDDSGQFHAVGSC